MSYYCDTYDENSLHLFYESDFTNQVEAINFIRKETLTQVFSCEYLKEYLFYRTTAVAASVNRHFHEN